MTYIKYNSLARFAPSVVPPPVLPDIPNLPPVDETDEFVQSIEVEFAGSSNIVGLQFIPPTFAGFPLTYAIAFSSAIPPGNPIVIYNTEGLMLSSYSTGLGAGVATITSDTDRTFYIRTGGGLYRSVYNPMTNTLQTEAIEITTGYVGLSFENDILYAARSASGTIDQINPETGAIIRSDAMAGNAGTVRVIATSPTHLYVAATVSGANVIQVRNLVPPYVLENIIPVNFTVHDLSYYSGFLFTSSTNTEIDVLRLSE